MQVSERISEHLKNIINNTISLAKDSLLSTSATTEDFEEDTVSNILEEIKRQWEDRLSKVTGYTIGSFSRSLFNLKSLSGDSHKSSGRRPQRFTGKRPSLVEKVNETNGVLNGQGQKRSPQFGFGEGVDNTNVMSRTFGQSNDTLGSSPPSVINGYRNLGSFGAQGTLLPVGNNKIIEDGKISKKIERSFDLKSEGKKGINNGERRKGRKKSGAYNDSDSSEGIPGDTESSMHESSYSSYSSSDSSSLSSSSADKETIEGRHVIKKEDLSEENNKGDLESYNKNNVSDRLRRGGIMNYERNNLDIQHGENATVSRPSFGNRLNSRALSNRSFVSLRGMNSQGPLRRNTDGNTTTNSHPKHNLNQYDGYQESSELSSEEEDNYEDSEDDSDVVPYNSSEDEKEDDTDDVITEINNHGPVQRYDAQIYGKYTTFNPNKDTNLSSCFVIIDTPTGGDKKVSISMISNLKIEVRKT